MDFVIGGCHQGKMQYVIDTYGYTKEEMLFGEASDVYTAKDKKCLYGFHLLIKKILKEGKDMESSLAQIFAQNEIKVIVSEEIGYGIVPVDAFEREYREAVGRQCCSIAKEADHVIRMVSGIAKKIKG